MAFWGHTGCSSFFSSKEGVLEELLLPGLMAAPAPPSAHASGGLETEVWGSVPSGLSGLIIIQDVEALVKGQCSWRRRETGEVIPSH